MGGFSNGRKKELIRVQEIEIVPFFERCLMSVREDLRESVYIVEGLKVLKVQGYRSAIGSFWNAVVDDLRNKIIYRSLPLFNKSMTLRREIKTYEDFQNHINDDDLIDGAYRIGVIGWEASKILKHAKETRHIFDGHPKSSEPSAVKVLSMMDDCIKYVLNVEYPPQVIDIDEYISNLGTDSFDRNEIAIENALGDLPEIYKNELVNKLYTAYINQSANTILRSNIEFVLPVLWRVLAKDVKIQVVRRVDSEISNGVIEITEQAFAFVRITGATKYLSSTSKRYLLAPIIKELKDNIDDFPIENKCVKALEPYGGDIPKNLLDDYVWALTHTYVGRIGYSSRYARTDFYANDAALRIPKMLHLFDENAAQAFTNCIKESEMLKSRIQTPEKLRRLRALGNIVLEKTSKTFSERKLLEALTDENKEKIFFEMLGRKAKK